MNSLKLATPSRTMSSMSSRPASAQVGDDHVQAVVDAGLALGLLPPGVERGRACLVPRAWMAKSTMVVVPPMAAARVPVSKSSAGGAARRACRDAYARRCRRADRAGAGAGAAARLAAAVWLAMLFISHDLAVVGEVASRVAVMRAGQVVETGTFRAFADRAGTRYTRSLLAAVPTLRTDRNRPLAMVGVPYATGLYSPHAE
jgi:hypothetical protein